MDSFKQLNYKLRPAKSVERKMIAESLRKLTAFYPLSHYQYVGFGSVPFVDFSLFHKSLGISEMTSIEGTALDINQRRVEFNKPFSSIEMRFKMSHEALPLINLKKPSIIWLDYDGKLKSDVLADINTVIARAEPGSVLLVTTNARAEKEIDIPNPPAGTVKQTIQQYRLQEITRQVSADKLPIGLQEKDLSQKNLQSVLRTIIIDEINEAIKNRNGVLKASAKMSFKQLFNFSYQDGTPMMTIGGILISESQMAAYNTANFSDLPFCRFDENRYELEVPNLTNKEVVHLDSMLHETLDLTTYKIIKKVAGAASTTKIGPFIDPTTFLSEEDIVKFAKIYRYYPTFAEAIW